MYKMLSKKLYSTKNNNDEKEMICEQSRLRLLLTEAWNFGFIVYDMEIYTCNFETNRGDGCT